MLRTLIARLARPSLAATLAVFAMTSTVLGWHLIDRWSVVGMRIRDDYDGFSVIVGPPASEVRVTPSPIVGEPEDRRPTPSRVRH